MTRTRKSPTLDAITSIRGRLVAARKRAVSLQQIALLSGLSNKSLKKAFTDEWNPTAQTMLAVEKTLTSLEAANYDRLRAI